MWERDGLEGLDGTHREMVYDCGSERDPEVPQLRLQSRLRHFLISLCSEECLAGQPPLNRYWLTQ